MSGNKSRGRRSRRGLIGSFKYSSSKSGKKKKSMPRRIAEWIGGGVMVVVMGFVLVLLVWRMVSPDYGVEQREGTFEPIRIEEYDQPVPVAESSANGEGEPAGEDLVGAATLEIDGYPLTLALTAPQLEGVQDGASIRVRYVFQPFNRGARITVEEDDWYVVGVDERPGWVDEPLSAKP